MKFDLRISAGLVIVVLALVLGTLAISVGKAYASAQTSCLNYPQKYPFMQTRYQPGSCQFRENDGWITFNPQS